MVYALSALKRNQEILITLMDVFIKEPQLDWVAAAKYNVKVGAPASGLVLGPGSAAPLSASGAGSLPAGSASVGGSGSGGSTSLDNEVVRYTRDKIRIARRKLKGDNPAAIMVAELNSTKLPNTHPKVYAACIQHILGKGKLRSKVCRSLLLFIALT